ncbi:hypothetical protein BC940DRAFT_305928 [Gongronella butleri]|nr:hypothetical protein BC940DRAFT_305928 [Gongronella butleri]
MQSLDEHGTFLLPRPIWVNDIDVTHCTGCNAPFTQFRRRHHCRQCGNIFCQDCSSKNVILPQLGYGSKPMRVCNDCFQVAYLVTYAISDDHGLPTQIHGARGLLELTEKSNEKDLHSLAAHGGIDALIWLCTTCFSIDIHHLVTTNLALLSEKESVRPVLITKCALPPLLLLLQRYLDQHQLVKKSPSGSLHSNASTALAMGAANTAAADLIAHYSMSLEIIINCTHVIYQLARAGILSREEIVSDGILDVLLKLCLYEAKTPDDDDFRPAMPDGKVVSENQANNDAHDQQQQPVDEAKQWSERETIICTLAAKAMAFISAIVANQPSVIERLDASPYLSQALRSEKDDVRKYIAKTVAYLSLRNDKYKSVLLKDDRVKALLSTLVQLPLANDVLKKRAHKNDMDYYGVTSERDADNAPQASYTAAVSHTCCALANFATNVESQSILMNQPHFLTYLCNSPVVYTGHQEIQRHVARCLANLALYQENHARMGIKGEQETSGTRYNVLPVLLSIGQAHMDNHDILRHIIRAIDNLSAHVPEEDDASRETWQAQFASVQPFLSQVMSTVQDQDTLKRTSGILARAAATPDEDTADAADHDHSSDHQDDQKDNHDEENDEKNDEEDEEL